MSGSLNKVQIIGNLGRDPEIRYTGDNKPIANLNVATSERWKDKTSGQQQEKTEWHRIVVFGGLAEVIQKYMKKGDTAYFEGKLQTRKWTDQQGQDKYTTEIVVDHFSGTMQMLGKRGESGTYTHSSTASGSSSDAPSQGDNASSGGAAMQPARKTEDVPFDDDIPF